MKTINSILLLLIALILVQAQDYEIPNEQEPDLVYIVMSHDKDSGIQEELYPSIIVDTKDSGKFHQFRMIPGLYGVGTTSFVSAQDPEVFLYIEQPLEYLQAKRFSDSPYFEQFVSFYIKHVEGYPWEYYFFEPAFSGLAGYTLSLNIDNDMVELKTITSPSNLQMFSLIDSQGSLVTPIKSQSLDDGEGHFLGPAYIRYREFGICIQGNQAVLNQVLESDKFELVEGFYGSDTTSIQSASNPNQYLKIGEDFNLYLEDYQADDSFNRQASFRIKYSGKKSKKYVRFQSAYNPDYYLLREPYHSGQQQSSLSFSLYSSDNQFRDNTKFEIVRYN